VQHQEDAGQLLLQSAQLQLLGVDMCVHMTTMALTDSRSCVCRLCHVSRAALEYLCARLHKLCADALHMCFACGVANNP
jgi:hypothetical protein